MIHCRKGELTTDDADCLFASTLQVQFVDNDRNILIDFTDEEPSYLGKNMGPQLAYSAFGRSGTVTVRRTTVSLHACVVSRYAPRVSDMVNMRRQYIFLSFFSFFFSVLQYLRTLKANPNNDYVR